MKLRSFVLSLALLICSVPAFAQAPVPGATPVQQYQPFVSCDQAFTATGAGNTSVVVTAPAQSGKTFYICTIDATEVANAAVTGAAGPAEVCTTANLLANMVWWGNNGTVGTGVNSPIIALSWGVYPLKSLAANTATTVTCSGGQSTYNVRLNMTGFYGTGN